MTDFLQITADAFLSAIEQRTRDNGEPFKSLRDGSPDWMLDAIHAAHGDLLPNNESYDMIADAASAISEMIQNGDDLDDDGERIDAMVPVGTWGLTHWLASHNSRITFCDEAVDEGLIQADANMEARISAGFAQEARQVFTAIREAIVEQADDLEADAREGRE